MHMHLGWPVDLLHILSLFNVAISVFLNITVHLKVDFFPHPGCFISLHHCSSRVGGGTQRSSACSSVGQYL